jgi:outer membrane protein
MKNQKQFVVILCLLFAGYLAAAYLFNKTEKIGVVQMDKLVYEFKGMKEASERYSHKMKAWTAQSDSLEERLKALLYQIRIDSVNRDQARLKKNVETFLLVKQSYAEYIQNTQEKAREEDEEMTLGVVNQINEYIRAYAVQEGFDMILINTQQQSVGYVREKTDVTGKVLEYANKKYEGLN